MYQRSTIGNPPKQSSLVTLLQKKKSLIIDLACTLYILLFIYTGTAKFLNFKGFIVDMNNQPFPNWATPFLVWSLPIVEISISILLMFEKSRKLALYSGLFLMSLFTLYTGAVLLKVFPYIPCSCGGVIKHLTWTQHMFFNLFFVLIAIAALLSYKQNRKQNISS